MGNKKINAELLKKQTFGVEVEMSNISQEMVVKAVADYFNSLDGFTAEYRYVGRHLNNWVCTVTYPDGTIHKWQAESDGSIYSSGHGCAEMVTPIMTYDDIPHLQQIIRDLRGLGAKSGTRYNAGVHIHVGVNFDEDGGQNTASICRLVNLIASHERLLCKAVSVSHERQAQWARFVEPDFLRRINTNRPRTKAQLHRAWYGDDRVHEHYDRSRYHLLNLHAIWDKGTVEFRCFEFHNNLHAGELKAWIQLCLAMCSYVKIINRSSPRQLDTDNDKYSMISWLKNMGLQDDEFKTCRRMLTKHLTGDSAYRHGRPIADNLDDYAIDRLVEE